MPPFHAELSLTSDARSIPLARAFVREMATLAGFATSEVDTLGASGADLCTTVISRAFEPGDDGTFQLIADVSDTALRLALREQGMPFDPEAPPAPDPAGAGGRAGRGLEWALRHHVVDEAHWVSLGKEGMELTLVKQRPQPRLAADDAAGLAPYQDDAPLAPEQEYTIRRLLPGEAVAVSQNIYRAWGYSYPNEDFYYPERIAHQNETGALVSLVAVAADGEIVGHLALERPDLGRVAESGAAVVNPAHRGRRLVERLRAQVEDEARRLGLLGIYGQPVTSHVFTQRMNEHLGTHVCGVSLGHSPATETFKHIVAEPLTQRETLLLYFQYLGTPTPAIAHAPAHHRAMLARIYAHLGTPVDLRTVDEAASRAALAGDGELAVRLYRGWGYGAIRVHRVGTDTAAQVRQARRDLCDAAGAKVVYLELPLAQPGAPAVCLDAEGDGFFFSGVGPHFAPDGDTLRLQYLAVDVDPSKLQIASDFARELVAYVAAERGRVRAPRT